MIKQIKHAIFIPLIAFLCSGLAAQSLFAQNSPSSEKNAASYHKLASQLQHSLFTELLDPWYPKAVDTVYGGYFSNLSYDFKLFGTQNKYIVTQTRNVWTLSEVASKYPKYRSTYGPWARQGVAFLRDKMWDEKYGGFYSLVTREGQPIRPANDPFTGSKTAYGNAFAIYALAEYSRVFKDTSALNLSIRTFHWLDNNAHDPQYGGYFQNIHRDGSPFKEGFHGQPPKDQNSTIHILEAFTELYNVWPDPTLKNRIHELLDIIRNKIISKRHYMRLFFTDNWTPISYRDSLKNGKARFFENDHVSFGHDVEIAYLMLEAARAIGMDTATILKTGKALDDQAIENGWDEKRGGIYDAGYYVKKNGPITIVQHTKIWWTQAEALNSFLLMAQHFPDDPHNYYSHFLKQWHYIDTYLIDHKHGGWYWGGIDEEPQQKTRPKGTIWKATYHDTRALLNCIERLNDMASQK